MRRFQAKIQDRDAPPGVGGIDYPLVARKTALHVSGDVNRLARPMSFPSLSTSSPSWSDLGDSLRPPDRRRDVVFREAYLYGGFYCTVKNHFEEPLAQRRDQHQADIIPYIEYWVKIFPGESEVYPQGPRHGGPGGVLAGENRLSFGRSANMEPEVATSGDASCSKAPVSKSIKPRGQRRDVPGEWVLPRGWDTSRCPGGRALRSPSTQTIGIE